jgi:transposase
MATKYNAAFKAQAVQLVTERKKPIAEGARDLGIPDTTRHQWVTHVRQHPDRPFVGSGHLRPEDQEVRDVQRRIRDWEEDKAIGKKARRLVANDRQSKMPSFMHTAPPAASRRGAPYSKALGAAIRPGGIARRVREPSDALSASSRSVPLLRRVASSKAVRKLRRSYANGENASPQRPSPASGGPLACDLGW